MNLPADFIDSVTALLGAEESEKFFLSLAQKPPVSIRFNPSKNIASQVSGFRTPLSKLLWSDWGYYLPERLTFTFDPLFHAGAYYVQEASSMFLEQAIRHCTQERPVLALDLCAAPGGKSTHIRSLLPQGSLLVANEVIRSRSRVLAENLTKWGHPGVMVVNNDPSDFGKTGVEFDLIVADVPCSGEGMFRKDPAAVDEWSLQNVEICWQRQRRIIGDIWANLKPGGILIYSTCTYNTKENEENIRWISNELGADVIEIPVAGEWNVTGNLAGYDFPVYRFLPHKTQGEGFFIAVLRKHEGEGDSITPVATVSKKGRKESASSAMKDMEGIKKWLTDADYFNFSLSEGKITASSRYYEEAQNVLKRTLKVVQTGITVGEQKGKDIIPSHSLALSNVLNTASFATAEVSFEQAIAYLRKEAIVLSNDVPKGYVLITYKNMPLGFAKNLGNRANNLYPPDWRIRSGYLPENLSILD